MGARHPLDVLISVLHFIRYEPETAEWLGGNCSIPLDLPGKAQASPEFLEYALSFGAENLLSVTYQWWRDMSAVKVCYEDLVANTADEMRRLAGQIGQPTEGIIGAIAPNSIEMFKALPNWYGWQGSVGLWRKLLPFESARQVMFRHRSIFDALGYTV